MGVLATLFLTQTLLSPPSIAASDIATQAAPNSQIWRQQAEVLTEENERLRAEIKRLEGEEYEVTAYTAGYESTQKKPGEVGYGITASGAPVQEGLTAACPKSMAFGTRLEIEGLGERVCQDRGGAITDGHIDIYFASLQEARQFGRQWLNVRIIEEESE